MYGLPKQQAAGDAGMYEEIQAMTQNKQLVIIGDFNCPKLNWNIMGDQNVNRLLEMLEDTFMTQIITQPTRKNNILELVLVNNPDFVREGSVGEKLTGCDHHLIRVRIRTEQELLENISMIPDYRKANFNLACELLSQSTWEGLNLALVDAAGTVSRTNSWKERGQLSP